MGGGAGGDFGNTKGSKKNILPENNAQIKHIFGNRSGHLADTKANRELLQRTANDKSAYKGTDKYGNKWHIKIDSKGRQIWVRSQNGIINEGGRNDIPRQWNKETGLNKNVSSRKRKFKKKRKGE